MYKKIKATKNNSLKKASIVSALAVLASCAVFMNSEQFFLGDVTSSSASSFADWDFGNRGWGRSSFDLFDDDFDGFTDDLDGFRNWNRRGIMYNAKPLRDDVSKANYEMFAKAWKEVAKLAIASTSSMRKVMAQCSESRASERPLYAMGKYIAHSVEYRDYLEALKKLDYALSGGDTNWKIGAEATVRYVKAVQDLQAFMMSVFRQLASLVSLPKIKDAEKIDELIKSGVLSDSIKLSNEVIEVAKASEVAKDSSEGGAKSAAVALSKDLLRLFINGQRLEEFKEDTSDLSEYRGIEEYDIGYFSNYGYLDNVISKYCDSAADADSHAALVDYASSFAIPLALNKTLNKTMFQLGAVFVFVRLIQMLEVAFDQIRTKEQFDSLGLASQSRNYFLTTVVGKQRGYRDCLLALVGLAPIQAYDSESAGIKSNLNGILDLAQRISEASANALSGRLDSKIDPSAIHSESKNRISKQAARMDGAIGICDVVKLLTSLVGEDAARGLLQMLDAVRLSFLEDAKNPEVCPYIGGMSEPERSKAIESVEAVQRVYNANTGGRYRFVNDDGRLESSNVIFDSNNALSVAELTGLIELMAVPNTLKARGIGYAYSRIFDTSEDTFRQGHFGIGLGDFISGVGKAFTDLNSVFGDYRKLKASVNKVKGRKTEESDSKKKLSSKAAGEDPISGIALFDQGNSPLKQGEPYTVASFSESNDKKLGVRISGVPLDNGSATVSMVLCPKLLPKDKLTGKENIDLPEIEIKDKSFTYNLSDYIRARGNYELHVRKKVKVGDKYQHQFLFKAKFYASPDGTRPQGDKLVPVTSEQFDKRYFDTTGIYAYLDSDKCITVCLLLTKEGRELLLDRLKCVFFRTNESANMESDQHGFSIIDDKYLVFTSSPIPDGAKMDCHVYLDRVGGAFLGKVTIDSSSKAESKSKTKDQQSQFKGILSKGSTSDVDFFEQNHLTSVDAEFTIKVPHRLISSSKTTIPIYVYDSNGENLLYSTEGKVLSCSSGSSDESIYYGSRKFVVKVRLPKNESCKLKISPSAYDQEVLRRIGRKTYGAANYPLVSESNVDTSKSELNKDTIAFKLDRRERNLIY